MPIFSLLAILLSVPNSQPLHLGHSVSFQSKSLGEERQLNVYLPPAYEKEPERKFPVIYLPDGGMDEDFIHVAGLVQFLSLYKLIPDSILVGMVNVDRRRDFTSPSKVKEDLEMSPTSGGLAKFLEFLDKELVPFVTTNYRTTGERTLVGQSLGGLLATEVLVAKPELFQRIFIISPSLWWNDQALLKSIPAFLKANPKLEKQLFIAVGEEHPVMKATAKQLYEDIQAAKLPGVLCHFRFLGEESHATILHQALYQAFVVSFGRDKYMGATSSIPAPPRLDHDRFKPDLHKLISAFEKALGDKDAAAVKALLLHDQIPVVSVFTREGRPQQEQLTAASFTAMWTAADGAAPSFRNLGVRADGLSATLTADYRRGKAQAEKGTWTWKAIHTSEGWRIARMERSILDP